MFCKRCGKQIADGSTSCQYCGAVVIKRPATNTYTNFNAPAANTSYQAPQPEKKQNKTPWKIIAPVVAVLLVVAIIFGVVSCSKGKQKEYEDKLRQLLEESTSKPVVEFMCDDFDNNGDFEAYAVVGKSEKKDDIVEYYDADICFVNEDSAELIKESVRGHSNGTIESDGKIYVSLEVYDEQTGKGVSLVYSASENSPVESEISGQYSNVRQENGKILATDETGDDMEIDIPNAFRKLDTIELTTFVTTLPEGVTDFTETTDAESTTQSETTTKEKLTVTTTQPTTKASVDALSIYRNSLNNGQIDNYIKVDPDMFPNSGDAKSFFVDLNGDGTDELLLSVEDKSGVGVRGYWSGYLFLGIQNGSVIALDEASHGGGSAGGERLLITSDISSGKPALVHLSAYGDGMRSHMSEHVISSYNGSSLSKNKTLERWYYGEGYEDEIAKVKGETNLYTSEGLGLYCYKVDGKYVSKTTYENECDRYGIDNLFEEKPGYSIKNGTYSNPLP